MESILDQHPSNLLAPLGFGPPGACPPATEFIPEYQYTGINSFGPPGTPNFCQGFFCFKNSKKIYVNISLFITKCCISIFCLKFLFCDPICVLIKIFPRDSVLCGHNGNLFYLAIFDYCSTFL